MSYQGQDVVEQLLAALSLTEFQEIFRAAGIENVELLLELNKVELQSLGLAIGQVAKLKKALGELGYDLKVSPEVEEFLVDAELEQYCKLFARKGLVRLEAVLSMEDRHIEKLGLAMGHALMLRTAINNKKNVEASTTTGSSSSLELLPEEAGSSREVSDSEDDNEVAELFKAAQLGDLQKIRNLLSETAVTAGVKEKKHRSTLLHEAARYGHLNVVEYLVNEATPSANVNVANASGTTPLHWAAARGHLAVVEFLALEARANVNAADISRRTPLHYAAEGGHRSTVESLVLKARADRKATCKYGSTPVDYAAKHASIHRFLRLSAFSNRLAKRGAALEDALRRASDRRRGNL